MKAKKNLVLAFIIILIAILMVINNPKNKLLNPKEVYEVSLGSVRIGYLKSQKELIKYFDKKELAVKEKYQIDNVYLPKNLSVEKVITFNPKLMTPQEIYDEINKKVNVTVKGYEIKINGVNDVNVDGDQVYKETTRINVLDKKIFDEALKLATSNYINANFLKSYLNGNSTIENSKFEYTKVYLSNNITVKEKNIPVDEEIFTDVNKLSKFLLFKTDDNEENYVVKDGDTIETIAEANGLSVNEFMIANPDIKSENKLLYEGEKLNVRLATPVFVLNEIYLKEEEKEVNYTTEFRKDNTMEIGKQKVIQQGIKGKAIVKNEYREQNGYILGITNKTSEIVSQPVNKIVVEGTKYVYKEVENSWANTYPIAIGNYIWPTVQPYTISSGFGYRWGKIHYGIDITGGGLGSPIYAIADGIVAEAAWSKYGGGNEVVINHGNGLCTNYAHMSHFNVRRGQTVKRGQVIGGMGRTGFATGVHLHFGTARCTPGQLGLVAPMSKYFNPFTIYK